MYVPQGSSLGPLLFILYINDLASTSKFSATLFADNTYLSSADKNLSNLEKNFNSQLQRINSWLKNNKLSLNYSKTTFLLINKHPYLSVKSEFTISINESTISKSESVRYLGLLIDDKLNWSAHTREISLQLTRCYKMLYLIRNYVAEQTLIMLFYNFAHSLSYGIVVWGTAAKKYLHEVELKSNNIVQTITWNKKFSHVRQLYKKMNLLKLKDVYKLELVISMHKLFYHKLSCVIQKRFIKTEKIYSYKTRKPINLNYFLPRVAKSVRQN